MMLFTVAVELSFPKLVAFMVDGLGSDFHKQWLNWIVLGLVVGYIFHALALMAQQYLFESSGSMIVRDIRQALYASVIKKPITFFDNTSVGELCNRLSSDVEMLQDTLSTSLVMTIRSLLLMVGGIGLLITISPVLSLLIAVIVPVSILLAKIAGQQLNSKSRALHEKLADNTDVAQEHFSNIRLIHGFNQQQTAFKQYQETTNHSLKFALLTARLFAGFHGAISYIRSLSLVAILWVGAGLITDGEMTIGGLTSFVMYTTMVSASATMVSSFWSHWMRAIGATERVFELVDVDMLRQTENRFQSPDQSSSDIDGTITLSQVDFAYPTRPEQPILSNFNLSIKAGERVAIVGSSGAGKSTITSLLAGFYLANAGEIRIDGQAITPENITLLRDNMAIVEQEPALFSGTIAENIQFSCAHKSITLDEIKAVAVKAFADDFIQQFPDGYDTEVGPRGVQLSGGQKQRIAIARALLKDPAILILDEATSALDAESEHQIQQALTTLMTGRTTIMIAHRLSTVVQADRIVVMDQGKIVQQGSHEALLNDQDGFYRQLIRAR